VLRWCVEQLGGVKHSESLRSEMSEVFLVHLNDGRSVVIKIRDDPDGRAEGCLEVQRHVSAAGLPCPKPMTPLARIGELGVHAEEWCPGGELLLGDNREVAQLSANLLADVMRALAGYQPTHLPLPNPVWVRWDYIGPTEWPPHVWIDAAPNQDALPGYLDDAARQVRQRMRHSTLQNVVGHGDWETQNLRWHGGRPFVIHDWDSVVYLPEAAIIGAAAGAFASDETPTLANVESSEAFLETYQSRRERRFTAEEIEVAWAASLWPAIHNARAEFRFNLKPVVGKALAQQAHTRLELAGA
jgi:Ser/Thr protein kinase RdoA (MazF antagonist)